MNTRGKCHACGRTEDLREVDIVHGVDFTTGQSFSGLHDECKPGFGCGVELEPED